MFTFDNNVTFLCHFYYCKIVHTKKIHQFFLFHFRNMEDPKQEPYEGQSPWALESIYYYQFYCCPECDTKVALKQDFIDHAFKFHPDSRLYFPNIIDGSLGNLQ